MVIINKIYTKTGDKGTTGLIGGERISKDSLKLEIMGKIDEIIAVIGIARTFCDDQKFSIIEKLCNNLQQKLFDIGSEVALPPGKDHSSIPKTKDEDIKNLEKSIDLLCCDMPELKSFVLPGGNKINAFLHHARTISRDAERKAWKLNKVEPVSKNILIYLNRLSDLLFAMARKSSLISKDTEFLWVQNSKWE